MLSNFSSRILNINWKMKIFKFGGIKEAKMKPVDLTP